jgi:hypothetical protein
MSCKRGEILREGYKRKAYTRSDGTRVKATYVPPTCIKDKGKPGKGKKLFTLEKGTLSKFGYSLDKKAEVRRKALDKAVKEIGYLPVIRKLNAVAILQKNTNPVNSRKFRYDKDWVSKKYRK